MWFTWIGRCGADSVNNASQGRVGSTQCSEVPALTKQIYYKLHPGLCLGLPRARNCRYGSTVELAYSPHLGRSTLCPWIRSFPWAPPYFRLVISSNGRGHNTGEGNTGFPVTVGTIKSWGVQVVYKYYVPVEASTQLVGLPQYFCYVCDSLGGESNQSFQCCRLNSSITPCVIAGRLKQKNCIKWLESGSLRSWRDSELGQLLTTFALCGRSTGGWSARLSESGPDTWQGPDIEPE